MSFLVKKRDFEDKIKELTNRIQITQDTMSSDYVKNSAFFEKVSSIENLSDDLFCKKATFKSYEVETNAQIKRILG